MPRLGEWLLRILATGMRFDVALLAREDVMTHRLAELTWAWVLMLLPIGAVSVALAIGASVFVGGWNFTWKPLQVKLSKINPLTGIQQMFSGQRLTDLGKACLLALVLLVVGSTYLWLQLPAFHDALTMPLPVALMHTTQTMLTGLGLMLIAMAVFAAIDVPLQRFMLKNRLKMSHQEAKQEHKETEGSPEVKGRIRQRMREMARKRMLAAVPGADLVVMNPTHFAVALKYDENAAGAPRVLAKGADLLAFRIRDVAQENRVPVLQAPPLARALYAHTEIDQEIPFELFTAVAQVLAYVYQLRRALAGVGPMPGDLPELAVPPEMDPLQARHAAAGGEPAYGGLDA
jgi:flagellar biosynthetic protein FlhB